MEDYSLLLGLDEPGRRRSLDLWKLVGGMVDGLKIGVPPLLANGVGLVKEIKEIHDRPVVADLKVADIGFRSEGGPWAGTNRKIVETAVGGGIDWVICQSIVGTSSIRECTDTAHAAGGRVLTLPYMTHQGADVYFDEPLDPGAVIRLLEKNGESGAAKRISRLKGEKARGSGWRTSKIVVSDVILAVGEECGVDGYIGPANHPEVLSEYRKITKKWVFATGVGRQGGSAGKVYEILGPKSAAIAATAIYEAKDPLKACKALVEERERARGKA